MVIVALPSKGSTVDTAIILSDLDWDYEKQCFVMRTSGHCATCGKWDKFSKSNPEICYTCYMLETNMPFGFGYTQQIVENYRKNWFVVDGRV